MLVVIFWGLVALAATAILGSFIVMITAGAVHSEVASLANTIPAWSFRESFFVSLGLTVLGSFFKRYGGSKD